MKKIIVFVALIAGMVNATQAQAFRRIIMAVPTAFELEVGIAQDDSVIYLNLSGSEENVCYQLFVMNGTYDENKEVEARTKPDYAGEKTEFKPVGNPIAGTGSPIRFPLPEDRENITCMVKAFNPCGEYEMKNMITSSDIKTAFQTLRGYKKSHSSYEASNDDGKTWKPVEYVDGDVTIAKQVNGDYLVKKTTVSMDEKDGNPGLESSGDSISETSNLIAIMVFAGVFLLVVYGILNRKRLGFGKYTEMTPPCTDIMKMYPPKILKRK